LALLPVLVVLYSLPVLRAIHPLTRQILIFLTSIGEIENGRRTSEVGSGEGTTERADHRVVAEKREAVGERSEAKEKGRCVYERKKVGESSGRSGNARCQ
jgi:hypothetical protein